MLIKLLICSVNNEILLLHKILFRIKTRIKMEFHSTEIHTMKRYPLIGVPKLIKMLSKKHFHHDGMKRLKFGVRSILLVVWFYLMQLHKLFLFSKTLVSPEQERCYSNALYLLKLLRPLKLIFLSSVIRAEIG